MIQQYRGEGDQFFKGLGLFVLFSVVFGVVAGRQWHTKYTYWEDEDGLIEMSTALGLNHATLRHTLG